MKNLLSTLTLLWVFNFSFGQVLWVTDYNQAIELAKAQNKMIVMDFWATWCGPCKTMDRELWGSAETTALAQNFIPLKIDVDHNPQLSVKYGIKSIPRIIVIDPAGNTMWDKSGFSNANDYLRVLKNIKPYDPLDMVYFRNVGDKKETEQDYLGLGVMYQKMLQTEESITLRKSYYVASQKYFKKVMKQGETLGPQAEMFAILNDAYFGNIKKALKKIQKSDNPDSELKNFVMAYCFKCDGNEKEMAKYKKLIKDPEMLAQLD